MRLGALVRGLRRFPTRLAAGAGEAGGKKGGEEGWRKYAGAGLFAIPIAATAYLGNWQRERYHWKVNVIEENEKQLALPPCEPPAKGGWGDVGQRRVGVEGTFDMNNIVKMGPRSAPASSMPNTRGMAMKPASGVTGFYLIIPFKIKSTGDTILINRGWAERSQIEHITEVECGKGLVSLTVVPAKPEKASSMAIQNDPSRDGFWFTIDPAAMAQSAGLPRDTVVCDCLDVQQKTRGGKGPLETVKSPIKCKQISDRTNFYVMPETHLAYCATWFGLSAAMTVGTYIRFFR